MSVLGPDRPGGRIAEQDSTHHRVRRFNPPDERNEKRRVVFASSCPRFWIGFRLEPGVARSSGFWSAGPPLQSIAKACDASRRSVPSFDAALPEARFGRLIDRWTLRVPAMGTPLGLPAAPFGRRTAAVRML